MNEFKPEINRIFNISTEMEFQELALQIFHFQYSQNEVYRRFCDLLGTGNKIGAISEIPFLPVELFKTHKVQCGSEPAERIFISSGTTGQTTSKHFVNRLSLYDENLTRTFEMLYGSPENYCFLALLPSYLEREGSSLVYMVSKLMSLSNHAQNGFYLYEHQKLAQTIEHLTEKQQRVILIGVSYALLDFSEVYPIHLPPDLIVMETGGMKGRKKEMIRKELHEILSSRFQIGSIHSEYGMTELLSQAYSKNNGVFGTPPWMKIMIRDINDPFRYLSAGKTGAINIIDLANINSCAFISTQDLGRTDHNGSFEVLGRFDQSDMRGCNLMIT
ncbi:MAG TPA: acyltransferase [Bacteroidales bacterium]|nr:acyltransferase [Bacteroidales bacterium]